MPFYEISPQDVRARLEAGETLTLVDVRQPWEYARYHIPGALLLPTDLFATNHAALLNPDDEIICLCEHGVRSEAAAQFLAASGYTNAATMTGGMSVYDGAVEAETT